MNNLINAARDVLSIAEAAEYASRLLGKTVTPSNISYLIQYGRVARVDIDGVGGVSRRELEEYYSSYGRAYKQKFGMGETASSEAIDPSETTVPNSVNWTLSFAQYKEAETTKHVHRLHPYKGKFIPQLVEYFIDGHTDEFKRDVYFHPGDVILDPFAGSGTTLVQACECGMHAVGVDVSAFNAMIANCKVARCDLIDLQTEAMRVSDVLKESVARSRIPEFEARLTDALASYNEQYFPSPEYRYRLRRGEIDEDEYGPAQAEAFLPVYRALVAEYGVALLQGVSEESVEGSKPPDPNPQVDDGSFLGKWYLPSVRREIDVIFGEIEKVRPPETKRALSVALSRAMRSCRATTHSDLATLLEPVSEPYYCTKHGKVCRPLFSMARWWDRYAKDTVARLAEFEGLRRLRGAATHQLCLVGDSRTIDLPSALECASSPALAALAANRGIAGIFSSPPYVGMIDYHEQHAYAYELFGFERNDSAEIGPMFRGKTKDAQEAYVEGVAQVLLNCKKSLANGYNVFLVANDRRNLYPAIAAKAGMRIVNRFHRPVLNRSEKDRTAYSETIFHMKEA
ncbi:MAG: hypothetical protein LBR38_03635 [Synergistaceae bacterium]|nr:hypothetical protein [Synergistaceae bacterium]